MDNFLDRYFLAFLIAIPICGSIAIIYFTRHEINRFRFFAECFYLQLKLNLKNKKFKLTGDIISKISNMNKNDAENENSFKMHRGSLATFGILLLLGTLFRLEAELVWWKIFIYTLLLVCSFILLKLSFYSSDEEITYTVNLENYNKMKKSSYLIR